MSELKKTQPSKHIKWVKVRAKMSLTHHPTSIIAWSLKYYEFQIWSLNILH